MDYLQWRDDIFGQPAGSDPVMLDLSPETHSVSLDKHFDHVDRALSDPVIHGHYSPDQIGIGLQLIYSSSCSNISLCYIKAGDEARHVTGIKQLDKLYIHYFNHYCLTPVRSIGNNHVDSEIGYICHMLWDIFSLCPDASSPAMVSAALDVMSNAMQIHNDNCIVSAIHGLGHWAMDVPQASEILRQWLYAPTTKNSVVLAYAEQATTGCII